MFSPLKTLKSTVFLFIGFTIVSTLSQAQETSTHFRFFEIELKQSVNLQEGVRSDLFIGTPFQLRSSCDAKNSFIVAVPANYPKRVYQIEAELKTAMQNTFSSDKIESLHTISATDLESICQ